MSKLSKTEEVKIELVHSRDTKGTHFFEAVEDDQMVPSLYIRKSGVEGGCPERIVLTIAPLADED